MASESDESMRMSRSKQARAPEQKQARRLAILRSAKALYQEQTMEQITMASIARHCKLAKGTVYLYFSTKEALFLALLVDELEAWAQAFELELEQLAPRADAAVLAALISAQLVARPMMLRLLGLMHNVLEQNIEVEVALSFKRTLLELLERMGQAVEQACGLEQGGGARFMVRLHVMVVGLGLMCRPSPAVQAAMAQAPELLVMEVDFAQELEGMIVAQLVALGAQGKV